MWKKVGSVKSGGSRASARSRENSPFESYHQNIKAKSNMLTPPKQQFCQNYIENVKNRQTRNYSLQLKKNMSDNSITSEGIDMFDNMRNILSQDSNHKEMKNQKSNQGLHRRQYKTKTKINAESEVKKLRKEHHKLKQFVSKEVTSFKQIIQNYDSQLRSQIDTQNQQKQGQNDNFLSQVYQEASELNQHLMQLEHAKAAIIKKYKNVKEI